MSVVVFRPAARADELLAYLRLAGKKGLTGAEMDRYMPRSSWRSALAQLEDTPGLLLDVERRPARPPRRRAWVRAVLVGEFTPGEIAADGGREPDPEPPEPQQPTLFDAERAA